LVALADKVQPRFRARFLQVVKMIKEDKTLAEIERLVSEGKVDEALLVSEKAAIHLGNLWGEVYLLSGGEAAKVVANALKVVMHFDGVNERALAQIKENTLRLVRGFTEQQRAATHASLVNGVRRGLNPREVARDFRQSIGLTEYQVGIVNNYRRSLESLDRDALSRQLRDARFDRTVAGAIERDEPLSAEQIDRMVERYTDRWVNYRAETIARTEALSAVHAGNQELYQQAIDDGTLNPDDLVREWIPTPDERTRDWHADMEGQKVGIDEPFVSGLGNEMDYPTDPDAPAEDRVNCRCGVTTRFTAGARAETLAEVGAEEEA
jgi:hypothetical protein